MKAWFFSFVFIFNALTALADSPLTSTVFSAAYEEESIVKQASETNGILSDAIIKFLIGKNPVAVKMAVINKLGWDADGKDNAGIFMEYLKRKKGYKNENGIKTKASADELLCIAYLKALDNYNDVTEALAYAEAALKKNKHSYTFNIITALIKSQTFFDSDWCLVFKTTDKVRNNKSLKKDMNEGAIKIIFEYMDLYKDSCK